MFKRKDINKDVYECVCVCVLSIEGRRKQWMKGTRFVYSQVEFNYIKIDFLVYIYRLYVRTGGMLSGFAFNIITFSEILRMKRVNWIYTYLWYWLSNSHLYKLLFHFLHWRNYTSPIQDEKKLIRPGFELSRRLII